MNLENINISVIDYPILFPNTQAFERWLQAIPIASNLSEDAAREFIRDLVHQFIAYTQSNHNGTITYNLPILALSAIKKN